MISKKITLTILLLLGLWIVCGCRNTIHGIGKDLESGGKAIERSSGK